MANFDFAFITDNGYLKITVSCINNLLQKKSKNAYYRIYLIVTGKIDKLNLSSLYNYDDVEINIIEFSEDKISDFKGIRHVSNATYIKFFIPLLINADYVLYLDGDIYINSCVEVLWNNLNEDKYVGAVWDPGYTMENELLGIDNNERTFNAGVLLFNCKKMRDDGLVDVLLDYYKKNENKIMNADQTVFNAVLKNKWFELNSVYNLQRAFYLVSSKNLGISKKTKRKILKNPVIVHFTTHSKPWMFRCGNPYRKKYMTIYKSVFGKYKEKDKNFVGFMKRVYEEFQYRLIANK